MRKPDLPALHGQLTARAPLVHHITNTVVQQFSANVLLAMGASPAMIDHPADAGQFASLADSILINFGTASDQQFQAADAAIAAANQFSKPWVLDPVSVGAVDFRTSQIRLAATRHPAVIRGNASEIMVLANRGAGGRGVDATDEVDAALPAAIDLAKITRGTVAVSGANDAIVAELDGSIRIARLRGGSPLMARVVGTGCALGSATAAYLGALPKANQLAPESTFRAALAAHAHFALAGNAAARKTASPGSFATAFLDALYELDASDLDGAEITFEERDLP